MNNPDTIESLQALSPDEIRVRVAELMGYEPVHQNKRFAYPPVEPGVDDDEDEPVLLRDYPASLDSCREFEDAMNFSTRRLYVTNLQDVMSATLKQPVKVARSACIFATPLQKCQAYILTKHPQ